MSKCCKKSAVKKAVAVKEPAKVAVVEKKCACECEKKAPAKRGRKPGKAVTFTVHAEKGKAVYVAGSFNDWNPTAKKLAYKNGVYSVEMKLAAGTYQYKFVIDGTWCADPENVNAIANDQGTFNSVITVK